MRRKYHKSWNIPGTKDVPEAQKRKGGEACHGDFFWLMFLKRFQNLNLALEGMSSFTLSDDICLRARFGFRILLCSFKRDIKRAPKKLLLAVEDALQGQHIT